MANSIRSWCHFVNFESSLLSLVLHMYSLVQHLLVGSDDLDMEMIQMIQVIQVTKEEIVMKGMNEMKITRLSDDVPVTAVQDDPSRVNDAGVVERLAARHAHVNAVARRRPARKNNTKTTHRANKNNNKHGR